LFKLGRDHYTVIRPDAVGSAASPAQPPDTSAILSFSVSDGEECRASPYRIFVAEGARKCLKAGPPSDDTVLIKSDWYPTFLGRLVGPLVGIERTYVGVRLLEGPDLRYDWTIRTRADYRVAGPIFLIWGYDYGLRVQLLGRPSHSELDQRLEDYLLSVQRP
jgi:hypothetical protein